MRSRTIVGIVLVALSNGGEAMAMESTRQNRVALVTGANKGIGFEIARKLATIPGITTVLACRNPELGTAAASRLSVECGADVRFTKLDLTDIDSIDSTRAYIEREFGVLDILVNNAAICFNDPTLYGKV